MSHRYLQIIAFILIFCFFFERTNSGLFQVLKVINCKALGSRVGNSKRRAFSVGYHGRSLLTSRIEKLSLLPSVLILLY